MHYKKRYTEKSARSKKNTKILIEQNKISNNVKDNDVKDNNVIDNNAEKASLIFNSELGDNENLQETQKACIEHAAVNSAIVDKDLELDMDMDMDMDIEPIDIEPLNIDIEFLDIDIKPVVINTEPIKTNTEQSLEKDKLQDDSVIETEAEAVLNNLQTLINSNNRGSNVNVLIEGIPGIISGEVIFENVAVVVLKHENISVYINPEKIVAFY